MFNITLIYAVVKKNRSTKIDKKSKMRENFFPRIGQVALIRVVTLLP